MADSKSLMHRLLGAIGRMLLFIFKSIFSAVLLIVLLMVIYAGVAASFYQNSIKVPDEAALRVEIAGRIVDQVTYTDPLVALAGSDQPSEYLLRDLIKAFDLAKDDDRINSAVLVLHDMQSSGVSKIEELGAAIEAFKASGKRVIAVADAYSQQQYLLASYADEIMMNPMGAIELTGFSSFQLYMAEAIEKLGINVHIFRTGPHKSAVEPLIATEMSDESREQSQRILDDIWASVSQSIISRREITQADLTVYSSSLDELMLNNGGDLAQLALDFKLVDKVLPRDQILEEIQNVAGLNDDGDFYTHVNVAPYLRNQALRQPKDKGTNKPKIGLLVAKGNILDGVQDSCSIGGDSTAYLLRQARMHDDLDALVIRVDSPGGSAFASEIIRREVELHQENGIPVFISMGSVAASGGYWISAPADQIWATPTTVTGSIGAFAALATVEDSLEKVGLYSDGVSTGPLAGILSLDRPLDERAKTIVQSRIDNLYEQFLDLVSTDREIPLGELNPIAGGRVWTGNQAKEIGLVDELGTLEDVIVAIAEQADLGSDYRVQLIEPILSPEAQLLKWFTERVGLDFDIQGLSFLSSPMSEELHQEFRELQNKLALLTDPDNLYLHCGICQLVQPL